MILIWLLFVLFSVLYVWVKWKYSYWKRYNVPGPKPSFPFGNMNKVVNFTEHLGITCEKWYK